MQSKFAEWTIRILSTDLPAMSNNNGISLVLLIYKGQAI